MVLGGGQGAARLRLVAAFGGELRDAPLGGRERARPASVGGRGRPPASRSSARACSHRVVARQACAASCASGRMARAARRSPAARRRAPELDQTARELEPRVAGGEMCHGPLRGARSCLARRDERAHPGGVPERAAGAPPVARAARVGLASSLASRRGPPVPGASASSGATAARARGGPRRCCDRTAPCEVLDRPRRVARRGAAVRGCRGVAVQEDVGRDGSSMPAAPSSCSASSRLTCSASAITSHGVASSRGSAAGLDGAALVLELAAREVAALVGDLRRCQSAAAIRSGAPSPRRPTRSASIARSASSSASAFISIPVAENVEAADRVPAAVVAMQSLPEQLARAPRRVATASRRAIMRAVAAAAARPASAQPRRGLGGDHRDRLLAVAEIGAADEPQLDQQLEALLAVLLAQRRQNVAAAPTRRLGAAAVEAEVPRQSPRRIDRTVARPRAARRGRAPARRPARPHPAAPARARARRHRRCSGGAARPAPARAAARPSRGRRARRAASAARRSVATTPASPRGGRARRCSATR